MKRIFCLAMISVGVVYGTEITGTLSVGFGQVGVSVHGTDFYSFNNGQCDQPGVGAGCFDLVSGTGSFANLVNFNAQINTIQDLPSPPLSGAFSIPSFISFDNGAVLFDLTEVSPGGGQDCGTVANLAAANVSCSIYVNYGTAGNPNIQVSPYLLTNGPTGTTVGISATMKFAGYTGDIGSGYQNYIGIFSTQLAGSNIADIYSVIANGGTETSSWAASFSPTGSTSTRSDTPEPSTILLALAGGLCVAFRNRRRV